MGWIETQRNFIQAQIEEIFSSTALRLYGLFLTGTFALSVYFMASETLQNLTELSHPVAWPGIPQIFLIRSETFWIFFLSTWVALIGLTLLGFLKKWKWSYFGLILCLVFKIFLVLQSYQFMGNYHYMPVVLTLIYLLVPQKIKMLSLFLVFFYLSAGLLKLNIEWFSGSALLKPLPGFLQPFGTLNFAFVVFLELVLSWLLLAPQKVLRIISLVCFVLFHLVSWHWVGYFYPLIMLQLLMIFPLQWMFAPWQQSEGPFMRIERWQMSLIASFWLAQALPFLQPGDSALTGNGRILSLNMYDAQSECFSQTLLHQDHDWIELNETVLSAVRVHCDPIVYLDQIQQGCLELSQKNSSGNISLFLKSKRKTDLTYTPLIALPEACHQLPTYSIWGGNQWLQN